MAMLRQSLIRPNILSISCRRSYFSSSCGIGSFRLSFDGLHASTFFFFFFNSSRISSVSYPLSARNLFALAGISSIRNEAAVQSFTFPAVNKMHVGLPFPSQTA